MSHYGTVGLDVGIFGRWSRLVWGALILLGVSAGIYFNVDGNDLTLTSLALIGAYFVAITLSYLAVYYLLSLSYLERANPWVSTLIFVSPAFTTVWWNVAVAPVTNYVLSLPFTAAMGAYIGVSFVLQWKIQYGGCEVVALPIIVFKKRFTTYCIPLVAIDAAENQIVETKLKSARLFWWTYIAVFIPVVMAPNMGIITIGTYLLLMAGLIGIMVAYLLFQRRSTKQREKSKTIAA